MTDTLTPPSASAARIRTVAESAARAVDAYRARPLEDRAAFLEAVADEIESIREPAVEAAARETGLPVARLVGEVGRTTGQLRLFASTVREGSWLGLRVDPADPERTPAPRPDLRMRRIPVGAVAVFAASNFPFAFSVAGGDTASALAAGCPVVVKAHEGHPETSRLVAAAVERAAARTGMPEGVFAMVEGVEHRVGLELVTHPGIAAVGFTGSRAGGLALAAAAAARPVPIPVFAEMSSVNPVFLLPAALDEDAEGIAHAFAASLTLGAGQFCTNPGLLFAVAGAGTDRFVAAATEAVAGVGPARMLSERIAAGYVAGGATEPGVGAPALFATAASAFTADRALSDEVFGAAGLIVVADDADELVVLAERLEGQLTATLQSSDADSDRELAARLLPILERRAGRILYGGWPTGVEVVSAMVHGGPYPATTDGRTTSVGTLAIDRFLRPVAYQSFPAELLPAELRPA
jgi:2,5-dioxopentanoate dehydrogenase